MLEKMVGIIITFIFKYFNINKFFISIYKWFNNLFKYNM